MKGVGLRMFGVEIGFCVRSSIELAGGKTKCQNVGQIGMFLEELGMV